MNSTEKVMLGSGTMNFSGSKKEASMSTTTNDSIPTPLPLKREVTDAPVPPKAPEEVKKPKKHNPWSEHVAEFRKTHPDLSFKEVLKQAKETYTKVTK